MSAATACSNDEQNNGVACKGERDCRQALDRLASMTINKRKESQRFQLARQIITIMVGRALKASYLYSTSGSNK